MGHIGIPDAEDADADGDGVPDHLQDSDGDGALVCNLKTCKLLMHLQEYLMPTISTTTTTVSNLRVQLLNLNLSTRHFNIVFKI